MTQFIKSINPVSVTHTGSGGAQNSSNYPASINTANSILIFDGFTTSSTSSSSFAASLGRWSFGSTFATYTKLTSSTTTTVAKATIVEFNSDVVYTKHNTITVLAGTTTNTDSVAVGTLANAFVIWTGVTPVATTQNFTGVWGVALELTNTTTVTATIGFALASDITVGYTVVEFTSNIIKNVRPVKTTLTTANTSDPSAAFTAVTTANSIVFLNGFTAAVDAAGINYAYTVELGSTTTVTWTRTGTGSGTRTLYASVVEFQSTALSGSVQRNTIPGTGAGSTNTSNLGSSVNTSFSWVMYNGCRVQAQNTFQTHLVLSSTLVTATVNGTFNAASVSAFEVIQFDNTPVTSGKLFRMSNLSGLGSGGPFFGDPL